MRDMRLEFRDQELKKTASCLSYVEEVIVRICTLVLNLDYQFWIIQRNIITHSRNREQSLKSPC